MKRLVWWLLGGSRGGPSRASIIEVLKETPSNANQIAQEIGLDWVTVKHHLGVLEKHRIISSEGEGYGKTYFISSQLEKSYYIVDKIVSKRIKRKTEGKST